MYVIIAGCNRVGASLVKKLSEEGYDVAIIDRNESNFSKLGNGSNCKTVTGIPIDEDVLKEAGIEGADAMAAVTNDDNTNIMVSQIAYKLYHIPMVITQINDPEKQKVLADTGIKIVCPTALTMNAFFNELKGGKPEA